MNIIPSEEVPFFGYTLLFLQKKTAHVQRNNGTDDFHILQLKPITEKSALKPKTQIKNLKYSTPERACELGNENKSVATWALVTGRQSKYIPKYHRNI